MLKALSYTKSQLIVGGCVMGCVPSSQRVDVASATIRGWSGWQDAAGKGETLVDVLARLDEDIATSEKSYPAERLVVITAELASIEQEMKEFDELNMHNVPITTDSYAKTLHQIFVSLDLYRRPMLAAENEDFIANINRKEMRRLELCCLRTRQQALRREQQALHARLLHLRRLYTQLQQLLESVWSGRRPGSDFEGELKRAHALRGALATAAARLRAAAQYAQEALRLTDDALPAWRLASVGQ